jgi:hypothetical protein
MRGLSLFESYNARFLDPGQVGKGFIYSTKFDEVVPHQHALLIGPRGSGKTTFLKMLTIPALHNWKHPRKKAVLERINYIAIYVPSDFTWYPEFRRPINTVRNKEVDDLLSYALFRSHVLLSVCDTLEHVSNPAYAQNRYLRNKMPSLNSEQFNGLCRSLREAWNLDFQFDSFSDLKQSINRRIRDLQYLLTLSSIKVISADELLGKNRYLSDNFFDDLRAFADAFSQSFSESPKWAICFDEVEIAPESVKAHILQSPRSFDQRFLIKCSASPFDEQFGSIFGPKMPMAAQDFTKILLTHVHQREVQRFSQEMFKAICKEAEVGSKSALEVLGSSFFEDTFELSNASNQLDLYEKEAVQAGTEGGRYQQGGFHARKFASLAKKDPSFVDYLKRRNIDLEGMNQLPENLKAAEIRKIISIVTVRDEFLFEFAGESSSTKTRKLRSRKVVSEIYTGAQAIFAICEGNPRWLIGLVRPLLDAFKSKRIVEKSGVVQRAEQSRRIQLMVTQYLSLLSTITTPVTEKDGGGVLDTIDAIGEYFFKEVIGGPFNPEPVLSLKLDAKMDDRLRAIIGSAMNQGAFVLLPVSRDPTLIGNIENQRVRLTHLLAPLYRLPIVTGRPIAVSSIFPSAPPKEERPLLFDLFGAAP